MAARRSALVAGATSEGTGGPRRRWAGLGVDLATHVHPGLARSQALGLAQIVHHVGAAHTHLLVRDPLLLHLQEPPEEAAGRPQVAVVAGPAHPLLLVAQTDFPIEHLRHDLFCRSHLARSYPPLRMVGPC